MYQWTVLSDAPQSNLGKTSSLLKMRICNLRHVWEMPHPSLVTLSWSWGTGTFHFWCSYWLLDLADVYFWGCSFPLWGWSKCHISRNFHRLISAPIRKSCLWGLPQWYLYATSSSLFPLRLACVSSGLQPEASHVLLSPSCSPREEPWQEGRQTVPPAVLPYVAKAKGSVSGQGHHQKGGGSAWTWPPQQTLSMMWPDVGTGRNCSALEDLHLLLYVLFSVKTVGTCM